MRDPEAEATPCRICGKPRGENVAGGTRCSACGRRQAGQLWITISATAAIWAAYLGHGLNGALTVFAAAIATVPAAFVLAVLAHELTHAAAAFALGLTVSRIVVGEGKPWQRIGRDPQILIGSVLMGNGFTMFNDPRRRGYRIRTTVVLLSAPVLSLVIGAAAWELSAGWPLPARAATVIFAAANLSLGVVTLIPVPTFAGRVWSDLATVLFLARADDAALSEYMVLGSRDRIAHLLEVGDGAGALATARAAAQMHPESSLATSLLAYMLQHQGQTAEAAAPSIDGVGAP